MRVRLASSGRSAAVRTAAPQVSAGRQGVLW